MHTAIAPQPQNPADQAQSAVAVRTVTVAEGDGIGPEITRATLAVLKAAGAALDVQPITVGEAVYKAGHSTGIAPDAWDSLRATKVFLKGPITTPQGGGYKSLNVTIRKTLGLYANVRPCVSYAPFVPTMHPKMDVVIVRENEEDLYAGIEHRQTDEVMQCLKLITRPGCERIVRYAFEYARAHGRKKVTCMTKDNIMKMTDGLFHQVFDEIRSHYPDIATDHMIIDIGTARMATRPEKFDVIVTPNLYGDILSDVAAELTGSVGLAGSANIGEHVAMFEAIHGSAPDIAGQDIANPSGMLLSAVMMLVHIGQPQVAERIHNAWLSTIEDGFHTADLARSLDGKAKRGPTVGTQAFAQAVIERLGQKPQTFAAVSYAATESTQPKMAASPKNTAQASIKKVAKKEMVGVDVFVHQSDLSADTLAAKLQALTVPGLKLQMITNRGVKVWPGGFPETFTTDHWRCRFMADGPEGTTLAHRQIVALLAAVTEGGVDVIKTENLCTFDGERGFALGQGQ
jgi:isocitrate dehydrogenase